MPTARPIIEASTGVLEPTSVNAVIAVTPLMPRPTPNIAVTIGRPAATREPNVRSRTASATAMPISSEEPCVSVSTSVPEPLASTVSPPARAWSMASSSASWVLGSTSATVSTSYSKPMMPTRPSEDSGLSAAAFALAMLGGVPLCRADPSICWRCESAASTGLAMGALSATWGRPRRSATRESTALAYVGSSRVCGSGAATTTFTVAWSKASTEPGNSSVCMSAAFSDGMPGMENESVIGLDMVAAKVPTASIATIQPAMNSGHRR